ncbi:MAG: hypothetical protein J5U17_04710 [Candidatus Methanoperedens sp.]|nr:hypothetical protein [Candidatus Methanoperedens sp.]MCE8425059.1 hypothetical protein [Candidatus Methanoperedens sp.]MCE8426811.1 hypothetical protein [Candidatus Methanoperedens sp.]
MEHIIIKNKKYSIDTLKILTGKKELDIKKIPPSILLISEAIDQPDDLPFLIETIKSIKIDDMEKFRFSLLRVQIDSELHMNEDLQRYQKRVYVSQIIEKLLYGELFFENGKEKDDDCE